MDECFVLSWEFPEKSLEGSGHGIAAVYRDEDEANRVYDLLDKYADNRRWSLDKYEVK